MLARTDTSISYILDDNLIDFRQMILDYTDDVRRFPTHTVLTRCGEPVGNLYFLLSGMVKIYTHNACGYVRILGYQKQNTLFAMDQLEPGTLSVVTTESVTPIEAIPLSSRDIFALCERHAGFLPKLMYYYCRVLRFMCFDAETQSIVDAKTRLASFLLLYTRTNDYRQRGYIPMSQGELASAINASQVQVARLCGALREAGTLRLGRRKVYIEDLLALQHIAQDT